MFMEFMAVGVLSWYVALQPSQECFDFYFRIIMDSIQYNELGISELYFMYQSTVMQYHKIIKLPSSTFMRVNSV